MKKGCHNKKRNTALLHEFLVRHITKCLVNNRKDEAKKGVEISKKYFSKGSALNQELSLFKTLVDVKVNSKESANKILNEVCLQSQKINARELDVQKSKLVKEINYNFKDQDFYGYKIPNYKIYASAQLLLNESRNKNKILEGIDRIKLEDVILEHLSQKEKNAVVEKVKIDPKYNSAVYKFVIQKFNEKYDQHLTENQKKFLTKYVVSLISENNSVLKAAVEKESKIIKERLRNIEDINVQKDKELMNKINECYKKFVSTNFEVLNEQTVVEFLEYIALSEQLVGKENEKN